MGRGFNSRTLRAASKMLLSSLVRGNLRHLRGIDPGFLECVVDAEPLRTVEHGVVTGQQARTGGGRGAAAASVMVFAALRWPNVIRGPGSSVFAGEKVG